MGLMYVTIKEIVEEAKKGATARELAEKYKLPITTIRLIVFENLQQEIESKH